MNIHRIYLDNIVAALFAEKTLWYQFAGVLPRTFCLQKEILDQQSHRGSSGPGFESGLTVGSILEPITLTIPSEVSPPAAL